MKICLIAASPRPSDLEGSPVIRIGDNLARVAGHTVEVIAFADLWWRAEGEFTSTGGPVSSTQEGALAVHRVHPPGNGRASPREHVSIWLQRLCAGQAFDALVAWNLTTIGFPTVLYGREQGIPAIASAREDDLTSHIFAPQRFGHIYWVLRHAGRVHVLDQDARERAAVLTSMDNRIAVIPEHLPAEQEATAWDELLRAACGPV